MRYHRSERFLLDIKKTTTDQDIYPVGTCRLSDVNLVVHGRITFHSRVRIVYLKSTLKLFLDGLKELFLLCF